MQFGRPAAALLFGLLPLLALLNARGGRRTVVVVPSLALWADVPSDSRGSATRPRLPVGWSFMLQTAALVAAILALMAPSTKGSAVASAGAVLVIDVSASMAATDVAPSRLHAAKQAAREVLAATPRRSRSAVVIAAARPTLAVSFTADTSAMLAGIDRAEPTDSSADLPAAVRLAHSLVGGSAAEIHVFTDAWGDSPSSRVTVHAVGGGADNVGVSDFVVSRATGAAVVARVRVSNHGREAARVPVLFTPTGAAPVARTIRVAPAESVAVEFTATQANSDSASYRLDILRPDALDADNHAYAVLRAERPMTVLVVGDRTGPLAAMFALDSAVTVTELPPDEYLPADGAGLTVFHGWAPSTLPRGAVLVLDPPSGTPHADATLVSASRFLDARMAHAAFRLVPLRDVTPHRVGVFAPAGRGERLMLTDAGPAAIAWDDGDQRVLVLGFDPFDLAASDMSLRPAIVVLFANVVEWAGQGTAAAPSAMLAGEVASLRRDGVDRTLSPPGDLRGATVSFDHAGMYTLSAPDAPPELIAVNVAGGESNLWAPAAERPAPTEPATPRAASPLWKWFAFAAVLFLVAEWVGHHRGPRVLRT